MAEGNRTVRRSATIAGGRPVDGPLVVYVLILVNVAVFVVTAIQARSVNMSGGYSHLFDVWELRPYVVAGGGWWTLLTAGFLHVNPLHILMNMVSLWIIGRDLERILGRLRFIAVYLVSLFGASAAVVLFSDPRVPVAGASGAVFGLMGGVLVVVLRLKINPGQVIGVIAINLVLSATIPNISLVGHVGGLVVGALLTAAFLYAPRPRRAWWQAGAVLAAVLVLVGLVLVRDAQRGPVACEYSPVVSCSSVS